MDKDECKRSVRALWKKCFGDSEAFMDLYFTRKYTDEQNIYTEHGGQVVSALQYFIYPFQWGSGPCGRSVGYLSGIATLPEYRKRGYAATLIRKAHLELHSRKVMFSMLIPAAPALFGYYRKFGYSTCSYRSYEEYKLPEPAAVGYVEEVQDVTPAIYKCFAVQWRETARSVVVLRQDDLETVVADWRMAGGKVCAVHLTAGLSTLVFVRRESDETGLLYELPHLCPPAAKTLSHYLKRTFPGVRSWKRVASVSKGVPFAQARVIRVHEALRRYAALHPDVDMCLKVVDGDIPANSGYYQITQGRFKRAYPAANIPVYSPGKLTDFLLQDAPPSIGFMMEG